jgi:hypothetical protein
LPVASVSNPVNMNAIKDLCSTLSTKCPGCFGFLDEDEHRFIVYPGSPTTSSTFHSTVTLDTLLQNAHSEISKKPSVPVADDISTLGIRLLELCFGTTLESNEFRKQLPVGDSVTGRILDYAAAIQWSKMVSEEAGPEYAEAIEWCLHAKQVSDGSWRKEIWTHVILPLDACHRQVSQKSPPT